MYFPYSISDSVVIGIGVGVGLVVVIIVIVIIIFICYKRKHKYIRKHSKSSNNAYVSFSKNSYKNSLVCFIEVSVDIPEKQGRHAVCSF